MRLQFILFGLGLLLTACTGFENKTPVRWPVYPGCEKFQSDSIRKWCFKRRFSRDLEQKLSQLPYSGGPKDSVWLFVRIDTSGIFHADSIRPEPDKNFARKLDSILNTFRALPAHEASQAVEIRFRIPVVISEQNP